jgi:hypothetical protein
MRMPPIRSPSSPALQLLSIPSRYSAARLAAERAIVAMTNGYGPTNARTRAARAVRASLIDWQ